MSGDFKKYLNIYEFECVLPGSGHRVKFRPITTAQMKRLLIYENETDTNRIEDALDELISTSIISEGFDIKKLYLQDRFFLLVELRKKTKGEIYKFSANCSSCNSQYLNSIDLGKLKVKKMKKNVNDIVKLNDNISVKMSFIIREMQETSSKYVDDTFSDLTETQRLSEITIATHASSILSIITPEGEEKDVSLDDKVSLLNNISQGEYELIRDWFTKNDFGTDFTFSKICRHCKHKETMTIPIDNFFF
uniref:Putative baseplate protein n=1 Tax=viral metagenome TaxID=1070528 RepID=A0A6M3INL7_9ZZZZ